LDTRQARRAGRLHVALRVLALQLSLLGWYAMRARDLRDVVEVLIIPSLERALKELYGKGGSRRTARLLVQQSVDQLYGMMVVDKTPEPAATPPRGITDDFELVNVGANHEFVEKPEGPMRCGRCGALDGSPSAALPCSKGPLD
jgi:hypothetical protein